MTPDQIIEVVTAFKNGKKIQSRGKGENISNWVNNTNPHWDFLSRDYRVALKPRVIYVNEYPGGWGTVGNTEKEAGSQAGRGCIKKAVKFVEVIED